MLFPKDARLSAFFSCPKKQAGMNRREGIGINMDMISSVTQNNNNKLYLDAINDNKMDKRLSEEAAQQGLVQAEELDSVTISGFAPPAPPEQMDFANMSDEELKDYVQEMQAWTGNVPGMAGDTDIAALSEEELETLRETLTNMSNNARRAGGPPPPPPSDVDAMSEDELFSLLEEIQAETGSIPGVEDSETLEVSSLTEEQMEAAKVALEEIMQEKAAEYAQQLAMSQTATAYLRSSL